MSANAVGNSILPEFPGGIAHRPEVFNLRIVLHNCRSIADVSTIFTNAVDNFADVFPYFVWHSKGKQVVRNAAADAKLFAYRTMHIENVSSVNMIHNTFFWKP